MRKAHIRHLVLRLNVEPVRYNQLKTAVLHVLTTEGWCDSNHIIERARIELGLSVSSRAVRMALLRYHRYGLIHREWRRGQFAYSLSDRGAKRLVWLREISTTQPVESSGPKTSSSLGGTDAAQ